MVPSSLRFNKLSGFCCTLKFENHGLEENLKLLTEEQMSLVIQQQDWRPSEDRGELWVLISNVGWAFILSFLPTLR